MMKRLLFLLLAPALLASQPKTPQPKAADYNVLLITVDTLRWDYVGAYGRSPVATPAIDRLAGRSLLFRHAYSHNPVTLPAHANILTGTLPLAHGVSDNALFVLGRDRPTIATHLKANGWATAAFIGAFPLHSRFGLARGFDLYDESFESRSREDDVHFVERPAAEVLAPARDWIAKRRQKWFAWVHLFDPHIPYRPPSPFREAYARNPYAGEVASVDAELDKFFAFLEREGLLERTLVVFTADHGEGLGEKGEETHSYFAYENTIRVPLLIHAPGLPAQVVEENAAHTDIFPTLCELLSLAAPPGLQGESLLPLIRGQHRRQPLIYFESLTPFLTCSWAPLRGFIRGRYKFIDLPIPEVYRLEGDAAEADNQAGSEDVAALRQMLRELMQRYGKEAGQQRPSAPDAETLRKLRSLGYISGSGDTLRRPARQFTAKDDLKTMLPVYNDLQRALKDFSEGRKDRSAPILEGVIAAAPGCTVAYTYLASIHQGRGETDRAVSVLKRGLAKVPGSLLLESSLGLVQAESGDAEDAARVLQRCQAQDPTSPEIVNYLGLALFRLGRRVDARRSYERAIALDPRYAPAHNNLGNLCLAEFGQSGDKALLRQAISRFQRAKELAPRMANARNGLAAALYRAGQLEAAISEWRQAEALFPDDRQIPFNLGIALLETGKAREALDSFLGLRERFGQALSAQEKQRLEGLIAEAKAKITR